MTCGIGDDRDGENGTSLRTTAGPEEPRTGLGFLLLSREAQLALCAVCGVGKRVILQPYGVMGRDACQRQMTKQSGSPPISLSFSISKEQNLQCGKG